MALSSYNPEKGPGREQTLLEPVIAKIAESGSRAGGGPTPCGRSFLPEGRPPMAIVVMLLLGLTHFVAALAGRIGTGARESFRLRPRS
jgi:hypothetical protein